MANGDFSSQYATLYNKMTSNQDSPPPSFEAMGIPLVQQTSTTPLGKIRTLASLDRLEWVFLVCSLLAVLATLGLGIARLLATSAGSEERVFVWLLLITAGFSLVYAVNGVLREQVYELLAYAASATVLTVYVVINYVDPRTPGGAVKLARLIVACLLSPPLVVAAVGLAVRYFRSGALLFRTVGAVAALQTACRRVFTAQSLLKLDAQLALSSVLLILHGDLDAVTALETAVLCAGSVVTVLWWIGGYVALRWELRPLVWVLLATAPVEPAYIVWKLVSEDRPSSVLGQCQLAAGLLALLVRLVTLVWLVLCAANFGLGVSQQMYPRGLLEPAPAGGYGSFSGVAGAGPAPPPAGGRQLAAAD